jgi:hypothetical protein
MKKKCQDEKAKKQVPKKQGPGTVCLRRGWRKETLCASRQKAVPGMLQKMDGWEVQWFLYNMFLLFCQVLFV